MIGSARAAWSTLVVAFLLSAGAGLMAGTGAAFGPGIEEHLGATVPLETAFVDEEGARVILSELARTPVILSLVYFRCPNACDFLLTGIADALRSLPAQPGKDYTVLTISIDEREGPSDARKAKKIGLESIETPFPPSAWRFLTGEAAAIRAVSDSVGFQFTRDGDNFDHPLGLVILSPRGKIVRYMNGATFLPADLKMSLLESSTGTIGPTIGRVLRFCFRVDPQSHVLVFNTLKVTGIVTLVVAASLAAYLTLSTRRRGMKRKVERHARAR